MALASAAVALLLCSGCFGGEAGPGDVVQPKDIPFMVTKTQGAITGDMFYRDGRPVGNIRVRTYDANDDVLCQVVTQHDGKFYCPKLRPATYRVEVNLKDWPDCTMQVSAGRFSNVTIREPTYSAAGQSNVCNYRP